MGCTAHRAPPALPALPVLPKRVVLWGPKEVWNWLRNWHVPVDTANKLYRLGLDGEGLVDMFWSHFHNDLHDWLQEPGITAEDIQAVHGACVMLAEAEFITDPWVRWALCAGHGTGGGVGDRVGDRVFRVAQFVPGHSRVEVFLGPLRTPPGTPPGTARIYTRVEERQRRAVQA
jgi:hypothetical protein